MASSFANVPVPLPFVLATFLIVLGAVPGWGVHLALPLSALMAAVAIWSCRPQHAAWRWAGWGSVFWTAEEAVWAAARLVFETEFIYLTDPLYYAGVTCWLVALIRMPRRAMPGTSFLVALPALLFVIWLLVQNASLAVTLQFPLIDLCLLAFAVPAIEKAFHGEVPEGRLLWWLGLFVRVLAGSLFVWLGDYPFTAQLFYFLWVFGYTFIALGAWIELRGASGGLWPVAYGLLGLEAVTGTVIAISLVARADAPYVILALALLLGYLLFTGMILLVVADRNRRVRAERELKQWSVLLEQLVAFSPAGKAVRPEDAPSALMDILKPVFPNLSGISITADQPLQIGAPSPRTFALITKGAEIGRLHFRGEPDSLDVLNALAPLLAKQMEGALSRAHWHAQALADPLTGLHNRRAFELQAASLVALAYRHDQPVSLAILDIDHFKRVNDQYGHPTGDEALKLFATILRRNTRGEDLVLRWGGEEFVLLLYGSTLEQMRQVVGRIRTELREQSVAVVAWPLTISGGLIGGIVPAGEDVLHEWLEAADQALLRAKQAGRDRIEVVPTDREPD